MFTGLAIALFGFFQSHNSLTRTTGTVTESTASGGIGSTRVVKYSYTVTGRAYAGQFGVRNRFGSDAFFVAGREISIYFASNDPALSYALSPPTELRGYIAGLVIVALGGSIIVFALRS